MKSAQLGSVGTLHGEGAGAKPKSGGGSKPGQAGRPRTLGAALQRSAGATAEHRQQFAELLSLNLSSSLVSESSVRRCSERVGGKHGGRYRGVTRHKRTQRYEAHIWEAKKQIYLGGFDSEITAAKSHDVMALKCKHTTSDMLNFSPQEYQDLHPLLAALTLDDVIGALRTYSKAQAAVRAAGGVHRVSQGRVQKPAAQGARPAPVPPVRKLSINTAASLATPPSSLSGGGDGVAHAHVISPRPPPGMPRRLLRSRGKAPTTPKAGVGERPAPMTPTSRSRQPTSPASPLEAEGMASPFGLPPLQQALGKRLALAGAEETDAGSEAGSESGAAFSEHSSGAGTGVSQEGEEDANTISTQMLPDEPSLTYSASEGSRLFQWMAVDSVHSGLEHTLTGAVLFRSPQQQQEHLQAAAALQPEYRAGSVSLAYVQGPVPFLLAPGALRPPSEQEVAVQPSGGLSWPQLGAWSWPA